MSKKAKATDATAQSARFIEAARELGADDDEATFKAKLARIAKQKPKDEPEPANRQAANNSKKPR